MATAYSIHDRAGFLALTVIARCAADAARAADLGCDPTRGPYRMERAPLRVAREAIAYWRGNATTDKAVDLTTNEGWDEL